MGLLATMVNAVVPSRRDFAASVPVVQHERAQLPDAKYTTYALEGYAKNELVYACIEELSTSAAEPEMHALQGGQWTKKTPIVQLLDLPNPFMDGYEFWATVIMYRSLAGNAYALKVRSGAGRTVELWLMRPDRVRVVPSRDTYISHYEYHVGDGEVVPIPARDVIQWKTRNPINQWYGMPPLMAASGRVDIDNWMEDFVKGAFTSGGMPGAILNVKQKVSPEGKEEIKRRFRDSYSGPRGWHELLILDNAESSYTPLTMSLGSRGLVIPELDQISEARIPMVFGVPQSLIGTRTSYENGGYANKRAEENHFWTGTLTPLYRELVGPLNRSLVPEYPQIERVAFDLSTVEALQGDFQQLSTTWANLVQKGVATLEEGREKVGLPRKWADDETFLIPGSSKATSGEDVEDPEIEAPAGQRQLPAPDSDLENPPPAPKNNVGRPSIKDDPLAREVWDKVKELKAKRPYTPNKDVARMVGISESTFYRYQEAFEGDSESENESEQAKIELEKAIQDVLSR